MKKTAARFMQKGFTLVELLIVIALLGALAVGLIGALDPFEQLKKGTDTGTRDLVTQIQTATIRYFSVKNNMPWCPDGTAGCVNPTAADLTATGANFDTAYNGVGTIPIANLITAGELKVDFRELNKNNLNKVFVTGSQQNSTFIACYRPSSKSFRADPNTKYTNAGVEVSSYQTACEGNSGATQCYWCVK